LLGDAAEDAVACGEAEGELCVLGIVGAMSGIERARIATQMLPAN